MMFKNQPQLQDETIKLQTIALSDVKALYKMRSDANLSRKAGLAVDTHISQTYTFILNIQKKVKQGQLFYWGIYLEKELIGVISLWGLDFIEKVAELGYFISSDHLRKGYMRRALKLVVNYALDNTQVKKICAYVEVDNKASEMLVKNLGFIKVSESIEEDLSDNFVKMFRYEVERKI